MVDMAEFCGLIDLCIYIPKKQEKRTGKMSPEIFRVLSSNQQTCATALDMTNTASENRLRRNLEFIWTKIDEKFKNLSEAFRYFDLNANNRVSFNEFSKGLETLKVKMTLKDQLTCF